MEDRCSGTPDPKVVYLHPLVSIRQVSRRGIVEHQSFLFHIVAMVWCRDLISVSDDKDKHDGLDSYKYHYRHQDRRTERVEERVGQISKCPVKRVRMNNVEGKDD